ncbi:flagellar hook-length control protein FliK [Rhodopseudomonas sp.]|uniref:flagellar hook-length control protein FliK n=1 Tax=Rhodopseudomonas sp. TaxID=1078 RepID=UPI0025E8AD23|nr:flagellar hook-length control protein FliK [Rhodopseudomonas sp.]
MASPQTATATATPTGKAGEHDNAGAPAVAIDAATQSATPNTPASGHQHNAAVAAQTTPDPAALNQTPVNTAQQLPALNPATTPAPATQFSVAVATGAPVALQDLAVTIAATAQSGKSRFEIRLDPAELGRIDVRIDVDRHGQVTSHLTVERPETLAMLRQDSPQLQRALDDAGLKTGDSGLQFSLRDQSSSGQNNGGQDQGRNAHRLIVSEEELVPAAAVGRSYGRMLGSSSGVDIRI